MIEQEAHQHAITPPLGRIGLVDQGFGLGHGKRRMLGFFVSHLCDRASGVNAFALTSLVARDGADHRRMFLVEGSCPCASLQ